MPFIIFVVDGSVDVVAINKNKFARPKHIRAPVMCASHGCCLLSDGCNEMNQIMMMRGVWESVVLMRIPDVQLTLRGWKLRSMDLQARQHDSKPEMS